MRVFKIGRRQIKTAEAYQKVFLDSEEGKLVLNNILSNCHLLKTTMAKDPFDTAHQEGERNVALKILHQLNLDTTVMWKELRKYEETLNKEINSETGDNV